MKKEKKNIQFVEEKREEVPCGKEPVEDQAVSRIFGGKGMMGMSNPVAGISREQAEAIAKTLGDGTNMGSWRTMSEEEFMKWWAETNNEKL